MQAVNMCCPSYNDMVVISNFITSSTAFLVLGDKCSFFDVFFKRLDWEKGPPVLNIVCDSWASSFSRRFLVIFHFTYKSYARQVGTHGEIFLLQFSRALASSSREEKAWFEKKWLCSGVSPAELNWTVHVHTVSWYHVCLLVARCMSFSSPFKIWNFHLINCVGLKKLEVSWWYQSCVNRWRPKRIPTSEVLV